MKTNLLRHIRAEAILGVQSDSKGIVWMLDNGMRAGATPKLVAWDSRADKLHKLIPLPEPVAPANAFVNDLAVDETHNSIYISDPAGGDNAGEQTAKPPFDIFSFTALAGGVSGR